MDCSPPGSSVHWILQARILEWVAMPVSRGSSRTSPALTVGFFTTEPPGKPFKYIIYWQKEEHTPEDPNDHFWRAKSKNGVLGAKAGHSVCSLHSTPPKGWANHLSPIFGHRYTWPHLRNKLAPPGSSKPETLLLVLTTPCCSKGPCKVLPEEKRKYTIWKIRDDTCAIRY